MKTTIALTALLALTACTTPQTILRNEQGQTQICGGNVSSSLAGGVIGYHIQKANDEDCVKAYESQGFEVVK